MAGKGTLKQQRQARTTSQTRLDRTAKKKLEYEARQRQRKFEETKESIMGVESVEEYQQQYKNIPEWLRPSFFTPQEIAQQQEEAKQADFQKAADKIAYYQERKMYYSRKEDNATSESQRLYYRNQMDRMEAKRRIWANEAQGLLAQGYSWKSVEDYVGTKAYYAARQEEYEFRASEAKKRQVAQYKEEWVEFGLEPVIKSGEVTSVKDIYTGQRVRFEDLPDIRSSEQLQKLSDKGLISYETKTVPGEKITEVSTPSSTFFLDPTGKLMGVKNILMGDQGARTPTGGESLYYEAVIKPAIESGQSIYVEPVNFDDLSRLEPASAPSTLGQLAWQKIQEKFPIETREWVEAGLPDVADMWEQKVTESKVYNYQKEIKIGDMTLGTLGLTDSGKFVTGAITSFFTESLRKPKKAIASFAIGGAFGAAAGLSAGAGGVWGARIATGAGVLGGGYYLYQKGKQVWQEPDPWKKGKIVGGSASTELFPAVGGAKVGFKLAQQSIGLWRTRGMTEIEMELLSDQTGKPIKAPADVKSQLRLAEAQKYISKELAELKSTSTAKLHPHASSTQWKLGKDGSLTLSPGKSELPVQFVSTKGIAEWATRIGSGGESGSFFKLGSFSGGKPSIYYVETAGVKPVLGTNLGQLQQYFGYKGTKAKGRFWDYEALVEGMKAEPGYSYVAGYKGEAQALIPVQDVIIKPTGYYTTYEGVRIPLYLESTTAAPSSITGGATTKITKGTDFSKWGFDYSTKLKTTVTETELGAIGSTILKRTSYKPTKKSYDYDISYSTSYKPSTKISKISKISYKNPSYKPTSYKPTSYKPTSYKPTSYKPTSYKPTTTITRITRTPPPPTFKIPTFDLFGRIKKKKKKKLKGIGYARVPTFTEKAIGLTTMKPTKIKVTDAAKLVKQETTGFEIIKPLKVIN